MPLRFERGRNQRVAGETRTMTLSPDNTRATAKPIRRASPRSRAMANDRYYSKGMIGKRSDRIEKREGGRGDKGHLKCAAGL